MDALIYSENLLYERGMDHLESQITLDENVTCLRAYSYDIDLHRWELDEDQPTSHSIKKGYIFGENHIPQVTKSI